MSHDPMKALYGALTTPGHVIDSRKIQCELPVPDGSLWQRFKPWPGAMTEGCTEVWISKVYIVQVIETPRQWKCIGIRKVNAKEIWVNWDEIQRIKNDVLGEDVLVIEIYPPQANLVDDAQMRWLWVPPVPEDIGGAVWCGSKA